MIENHKQTEPKATLFYDSDCPICSAEMNKLCQLKNDSLELVPINQLTQDNQKGINDISKLYDELHIRTADGGWLTGYQANIYAWQQTKFAPIAKWLGIPPLKWMGQLGYQLWLKWYRWQRSKRTKS